MPTAKQLSLFPTHSNQRKNKTFFGGALLKGRRKTPRPISFKNSMHIVLKSQFGYAGRAFKLKHNQNRINKILDKASSKYKVKIYRKAFASNHIHLIIKAPARWHYRAFISVISGKIASAMMDHQSFKKFIREIALEEICGLTKPGEGYKTPYKGQAFWDFRPFTRIINWGKDFHTVCDYLLKNAVEALGFIPYTKRKINYAYKKELRRNREAKTKNRPCEGVPR